MATDPDHIMLTDDQLARLLSQLAQQAGKSPQDVLSEALLQYRPKVESKPYDRSLLDRLAAKGVIGALKGGPPDLSTNPKHFEGFGERDH